MQLRLGRFWKFLFGIPLAETTFARRGFRAMEDRTRQHLERIGAAFVDGYHAALLESAPESLAQRLLETAPELVRAGPGRVAGALAGSRQAPHRLPARDRLAGA